jgi:hypothetical protein
MERFALICGVLTLTIIPSYSFFKYRTAGSWEEQDGWGFSKLFVGFAFFEYVPRADIATPYLSIPFRLLSVSLLSRFLFLF